MCYILKVKAVLQCLLRFRWNNFPKVKWKAKNMFIINTKRETRGRKRVESENRTDVNTICFPLGSWEQKPKETKNKFLIRKKIWRFSHKFVLGLQFLFLFELFFLALNLILLFFFAWFRLRAIKKTTTDEREAAKNCF